MTQDPKDPKDGKDGNDAPRVPPAPPDPTSAKWRKWYVDVRVAVDDLEAVTQDRLKRKRKRNLGIAEATRLYKEARDRLAELFAYADRGGRDGGDEASPAH